MAEASAEAARIMGDLGDRQLAFAREQYDRAAPIMESIANQQMAAQAEQMAQARDYYNYQQSTFRPLERSIVADAQNFNTEAYRNQLANQAAADTGRAFGIANQVNARQMGAMGVNPNSGRFATTNNASNLTQAAARANAMTGTRERAAQMGYARQLDAAGLGRGLAGASAAAYGGATGAGSAAGMSAQSAGQNFMGNMGAAGNTYNSGFNTQISGLSSILNNQTNAYVNGGTDIAGSIGGIMGGVANMYSSGAGAALGFPSDRRLKENVERIGFDERTKLPLYEFSYKNDERRFVGVMADEVERVFPQAVIDTDLGFKAVNYDMLGIEFREVV
jgi:hypothetical protein